MCKHHKQNIAKILHGRGVLWIPKKTSHVLHFHIFPPWQQADKTNSKIQTITWSHDHSFFHRNRSLFIYSLKLQDFKSKRLPFGDYFDWYIEWSKRKHWKNVMFLKYEEIKMDHRGSIIKIARYNSASLEKLFSNILISLEL